MSTFLRWSSTTPSRAVRMAAWWAVGAGPYTVGFESMRSWRDWQSTTTPIGLGGSEFENNTPIGPIRPGTINLGGFAQPAGNKLSIGAYGGAGAVGAGGYLTLGLGGC
jgi:hypothetical protein